MAQAHEFYLSGRAHEAEQLYRELISSNARHHEALNSLGVLLCENGRVTEAIQYLEGAIAVAPNPRYLTNLGVAYRVQGRLDMAAESFGRILEIDPNSADARLNLALVLMDAGANEHALPLLEEAAQLGPDGSRLRSALSRVSLYLNRVDASVAHAKRAIELGPNEASTHRQLGDALDAHGEKTDAIASYRRAVELDPSDDKIHSNLIVAMLSSPEHDAKSLFVEARAWARRHAEPLREHVRPLTNVKDPERRLRVGYVSPDFSAHAVQQFLVPLFESHDQSAFEIFLYSSVGRPDLETEWYREFASGNFREIRYLDDVKAAKLVRDDEIDILVDLALHEPGGRLRIFACRPAPVQITWLGYMGTTGLETIDYRLTDPYVDPPGADLGVYSETCLHLPETVWCYAALNSELQVGDLPAVRAGCVTFGSQNTHRKLHPGVLRLWARVLREIAGSRLFLHAEEHAQEGLRRAFAREGVQPDRLEFGERVSRIQYLRRYQRIDIGLDTFPFNGATTTLDATWMGVPVITLSGASSLQRAGYAIASNLGLPELIANSEDAFIDRAVTLAGDLEHLAELRAGLRSRLEKSPLGNAPRFARHIEAAYRGAWRRYCAGSQHGRR